MKVNATQSIWSANNRRSRFQRSRLFSARQTRRIVRLLAARVESQSAVTLRCLSCHIIGVPAFASDVVDAGSVQAYSERKPTLATFVSDSIMILHSVEPCSNLTS
jgi:hypothetical protein